MLPILQIGRLAVPVPALVMLAGVWTGITLSERSSARHGLNANDLYNLIFLAIIAGVMGARLSYVIRYPSIFTSHPISILSRDPGLLDPWGGLAAAILVSLIYGQRKNIPFWPLMDTLTPGLAVLGVALGISHLASGNAFGAPTDLPWGVNLWGAHRHPTQIYEMILALAILLVVWPSREMIKWKNPGERFIIFMVLTAAARLFLETFRGDSILLPGGIRSAQLIAWVVLGISMWTLGKLHMGGQNE
jgi:phosphatidylglycerol:prolipoprotein diacylglycerol transferase